MTTVDTSFSLVLVGRFPGKDRAVAQALVREFGRDDAWGLQVVLNAPIILLDGLTADQAQTVYEALAEVESAGSKLEIQRGDGDGLSKISWPSAPRIRGRALSELSAGKSTATLIVPCPYTGQKMKLTISIQAARIAVEASTLSGAVTHPQVQAVQAPSGSRMPRPNRTPQPPAGHTPMALPALPRNPSPPIPVPVPVVTPSGSRQPAPPPIEDVPIIGLESLDELVPMEQFPPEAAVKAPPRSPVRGNTLPSHGVPLPDVPVLQSNLMPPQTVLPPQAPADAPPSVEAPMDLEVFEQKVSSSGVFRAAMPAAQEPPPEDSAEEPPPQEELCSVFIGKSNNARVHQVLAEIHGIAAPDAAKLCQRPVVAVAKDISMDDAQQIKQMFAAVNMPVRITKKRMNS